MPRFVTILRGSGGGRHTVAPGRSHQPGNARTLVEWRVIQSQLSFKHPTNRMEGAAFSFHSFNVLRFSNGRKVFALPRRSG